VTTLPPTAEHPAALQRRSMRVVLKPKTGWQPIDLAELWRFRELLWILALRDVKVRYKQTALGVAWALIQPFMLMIGFTLLSNLTNRNVAMIQGVPKPIFFFTGLIVWQLFATAMSNAGNSLISNQNLITKIYFPRLAMPIAAVITSLIDFVVAAALLALMMVLYHVPTVPQLILAPLFVALAFFAALAVGLWLSALNVEYRDVRYVIPFIVQFGLFVTPLYVATDSLSKPWQRLLFGLNPMSGIVEGFRWCVYGRPVPGPMLAVSLLSIVVTLVGGLFYFRRMEKTFADRV
jgi:lipopolysaccharide transport system permease protein